MGYELCEGVGRVPETVLLEPAWRDVVTRTSKVSRMFFPGKCICPVCKRRCTYFYNVGRHGAAK